MSEATLSARNRIVIPREAREALGVKAGDKLPVVVRGDQAIVLRKSAKRHAAIRGLSGRRWPPGFLNKERASWD
jgi:AbrB family looped-hinge helix DNA binding protein